MRVEALIIDPQNDFCSSGEDGNPKGSLYVDGAYADSQRLAEMIRRVGDKLDDIHVTLDTHRLISVAHPRFWVNSQGQHPGDYDFQIITADDVKNGTWKPISPAWTQRMIEYTQKLQQGGRYPLCVWPEHCLIGSWGTQILECVYDALTEYERSNYAVVDYVTKGSNMYTEHYSAVKAEVPDPEDDSTQLNMSHGGIIQTLKRADIIALMGQAKSHCLANTVVDIANNFGEENVKKMVLLEDLTSPVTGFENLADDFMTEMTARGMQVTTSDQFLT